MTTYGSSESPVVSLRSVTFDTGDSIYVPKNTPLTFTDVIIRVIGAMAKYRASSGILGFSQTSDTSPFDMTFTVTSDSAYIEFFQSQYTFRLSFTGVDCTSPLRVKAGGSWHVVKKPFVKVDGEWKAARSVYVKIGGEWVKK